MSETSSQNCKNCKYIFNGECRRYAPRLTIPVVTALSKDGKLHYKTEAAWPKAKQDDWCGEFQEK